MAASYDGEQDGGDREADAGGPEALDAWFSTDRTAARGDAITVTTDSFREFLYDPADAVLADWRGLDYEEFSRRKREPDFVQELLGDWRALYDEPFVGITADGTVDTTAWTLDPAAASAGTHANGEAPVAAARRVLELLDGDEREAIAYPLDAPEWRAWSNPEFVIHRVGLRLEDLAPAQVEAVLGLVEASLSPEGYARVREAMDLNGYLGELTELTELMNPLSYWVAIYGDPSADAPWGWQLFGHHVALNCVFVGGRQVIAPVFIGAEPALSDGAHPPIFDARERMAIALASSLTDEQRGDAVVYDTVLDPAMPEGRVHPADERHVAGAFRDNRVVPYEGLTASSLDSEQWRLLLVIVEDFLLLLPADQRALALAEVRAHLPQTRLAWYGATDGSQPFYLRIQSPVILAELDHHAGVWLSNRVPQRFHVHTTLRLPNGNDYGKAFIAQWRAGRAS
ncbi:DUF3500 domain-containing protein [uncultured Demequina sp.]|uniref:DUF3500 domain-containing protein n=1 Tax=uncultured Demequina sp. TaxID=693499 RepID=UPI0025FC0783|nr:DUF3500 domain-containing protein [uncultured Demequina sp.]